MEAGKLDRSIIIARAISLQGPYGDETVGYVQHITVPAQVEESATQSDGEKFEGDQLTASQYTKFTIRYRAGIIRTMVIVYGEQWFDIKSISEIPRRKGLVILATWKDAQVFQDTPAFRILENNDIAAYEPKIYEG